MMRAALCGCLLFLTAAAGVAPAVAGQPGTPPVADGSADARQDFADGILILLGGNGVGPARLDLGEGRILEVATDYCALGPDPEGYKAAYNLAMKQRIREVYGVDVDEVLLEASP